MSSYARHLRRALCLAYGAAFLCCSGCVTEVVKPVETVLFKVPSADGNRLSWKGKSGEFYTLLYSDGFGGGARWNILPGCERIPGTGQMIEKVDRPPVGTQRYYRISTIPAASR